MAYQTHTTEAIVCGSFERGTADRLYQLFTRDFGMLYATARSVRREQSKQRYALQDCSRLRVSLVQGKAGWRIGSVVAQENYYLRARNRVARGSVVQVVSLLRRYVRGAIPDPALYETVVDALQELSGETVLDRRTAEYVISVQLLWRLGYVSAENLPEATLRTKLSTQSNDDYTPALTTQLRSAVASAQAASQL